MPVDDEVPLVSLLVATIGRPNELRRLFDSLVNQVCGQFEVILVDQSRASNTVKLLAREFSERLNITYLRDEGTGLSRARNLALSQAKGSHLGFPDDDCWYGPDVIAGVLERFADAPGTGIVSGLYTEPGKFNPAFASSGGPLSLWNVFDRACSVGLFLDRKSLHGCSVFFDERIGAGTSWPVAEEIDLVMRLLRADVSGSFDPTLVVYHAIARDKSRSMEEFVATRQAFWYVVAKNYPFPLNVLRFMRGIAGVVLNRSPYGLRCSFGALVSGVRAGMRQRERKRVSE